MSARGRRWAPGDRWSLLCSDGDGATCLAPVTATAVKRLTDGSYRITAERPRGLSGQVPECPRVKFTVDATGVDLHGYAQPLPGGAS